MPPSAKSPPLDVKLVSPPPPNRPLIPLIRPLSRPPCDDPPSPVNEPNTAPIRAFDAACDAIWAMLLAMPLIIVVTACVRCFESVIALWKNFESGSPMPVSILFTVFCTVPSVAASVWPASACMSSSRCLYLAASSGVLDVAISFFISSVASAIASAYSCMAAVR